MKNLIREEISNIQTNLSNRFIERIHHLKELTNYTKTQSSSLSGSFESFNCL